MARCVAVIIFLFLRKCSAIIDFGELWDNSTLEYGKAYGYNIEEHVVRTQDKYFLSLFRIPRGINESECIQERVPVIVQHGIFSSSDFFVLRGQQDLVFKLAEFGFDVWLTNVRGSKYSRNAVYSADDYRFFNYTIDDIAANDLPVIIDYILNKTEYESLAYIGHSLGNTVLLMLLASYPEYNNKVHYFGGIAPVAFQKHSTNPLLATFQGKYSFIIVEALQKYSETFRNTLIPSGYTKFLGDLCDFSPVFQWICPFLEFTFVGFDWPNYDYNISSNLLNDMMSGVALKIVIQQLQMASSNRFAKYDYGGAINEEKYGTGIPPAYDLTSVRVPSYLYYGPNDPFVQKRDLKKLVHKLPNVKRIYEVSDRRFNHLDYIVGLNTNQYFFPTFLEDIISFHFKFLNQKKRFCQLNEV